MEHQKNLSLINSVDNKDSENLNNNINNNSNPNSPNTSSKALATSIANLLFNGFRITKRVAMHSITNKTS